MLVRLWVRPVHPGDFVNIAEPNDHPLPAPRCPGLEGMGVVESVGDGVAGVDAGTRVAFLGVRGSWGEYLQPILRLRGHR